MSPSLQADTKKAEDAKVYLALPATWLEVQQEEKQTGRSFHHAGAIAVTKDSFQIASLTCSTKLTQNGEDYYSPGGWSWSPDQIRVSSWITD